MVRLHKVYGNLMVDLRATNAKLLRRAAAADDAGHRLQRRRRRAHHCRPATTASRSRSSRSKRGIDTPPAERLLLAHGGSVHGALEAPAA